MPTAVSLNRLAPVQPSPQSKREAVQLSLRLFQYHLEVLADELGRTRTRGRLRASITAVDEGYRLLIAGFRYDDEPAAKRGGVYRVFYDNGDCPIASREEAVQLYRIVIKTAQTWLARQLDVDLQALPSRK